MIAWGAEAAQYFMAQGIALAILAVLQTLPEFAVEAVLAWETTNAIPVRKPDRRSSIADRARLASDLCSRGELAS